MKKRIFLTILLIILCLCLLTSCNKLFGSGKGTYQVTFNSQGGSSVAKMTFKKGESCVIETSPVSIRAGYTFSGWFANKQFTGSAVSFPYTVTANITLYAKWVADTPLATYNVTFNSMGGSSVAALAKVASIAASPQTNKDNHNFLGWFLNEECDGEPITFPYTVTADITLYAGWQAQGYSVSFDTNGGTDITTLVNVTSIDSSPETTKDFYDFVDWHLNEECEGEPVAFPFTVTENTTLYAGWQLANPEMVSILQEYYFGIMTYDLCLSSHTAFGEEYYANEQLESFYNDIVTDRLTYGVTAPKILLDCSTALAHQLDGTFDTYHSPREYEGITYTPSIEYNNATREYTFKLLIANEDVSPATYHWVEVTLVFDNLTNSAHIEIFGGIGEQKAKWYTVELIKLSGDRYVSWLRYTTNEEDDSLIRFNIYKTGVLTDTGEVTFTHIDSGYTLLPLYKHPGNANSLPNDCDQKIIVPFVSSECFISN